MGESGRAVNLDEMFEVDGAGNFRLKAPLKLAFSVIGQESEVTIRPEDCVVEGGPGGSYVLTLRSNPKKEETNEPSST